MKTIKLILSFFLIAFFNNANAFDGTCSSGLTFIKGGTLFSSYSPSSGCTNNFSRSDSVCVTVVPQSNGCYPAPQISTLTTAFTCPANSTKSSSGCTCNSGYRENTTIGMTSTTLSCDPELADPSSDIMNYAIGAGLVVGGIAAALAACTFGVVLGCTAAIGVALGGAGIIAAQYASSGDSSPIALSPDPCAGKTCVTVQLDPNKPVTGADNYVSRDSKGNFKPVGSGWTNNGDGTFTATVSGGSVTVNTSTDRVVANVSNSSGNYVSAYQSSSFGVDTVSQASTPDGSYTALNTASFNNSGLQTSQHQSVSGSLPSNTTFNGTFSTGVTGGGNGSGDSGTGDGEGESGGDCATYGCAKESTLQQVKAELQNTRYEESQEVKSDLNDLADSGINDAADRMEGMLQGAIDDLGLDSLFDTVLDNLQIKKLIETNSANCSYSFSLLHHPYELSICKYQETIHSILAFLFFIALSFGIVSLIFERPGGKD